MLSITKKISKCLFLISTLFLFYFTGLSQVDLEGDQSLLNKFNIALLGNADQRELPPCPPVPENLKGRLLVNLEVKTWREIESNLRDLKIGGEFSPGKCEPTDKVAVLIAYRNREDHLKVFLAHIHPFLMRQNIHYRIFVVEQSDKLAFNRALLFNVGFTEAMKTDSWQCLFLHDVDHLPEDDRNLYTCPDLPRHLAVGVDRFKYKLPYKDFFGGVSSMSTSHFRLVNGFSNQFWGWGGEDDEMYTRVRSHGLSIIRDEPDIARYTMIKHVRDKGNELNKDRFNLLGKSKKIQDADGLNNLKYDLVNITLHPLYTLIRVKLFPLRPSTINKYTLRRDSKISDQKSGTQTG